VQENSQKNKCKSNELTAVKKNALKTYTKTNPRPTARFHLYFM